MDFAKGRTSPLEQALAGGKRAARVLDGFEGAGGRFKGVPLALVALTVEETNAARMEAITFVTVECKLPEAVLFSAFGEQHLDFAIKCSTIARALVDPATLLPVAVDDKGQACTAKIRASLEADEATQLFDLYVDFIAERSPIARAKSWADVEAEVMAMGKGMIPASWLARFDGGTLRTMVFELAQRVAALTSTSANSSHTSTSND